MRMMGHNVTLVGSFVNLRILAPDDASLTLSWRMSKRARYLNVGAQTIEDQANWIASRPESEFNFVIELKDKTPIGMLSLVDINYSHRRAEPARFIIGNEHAVRGIPAAAEAEKLLYGFAFDEVKLLRLYGTVAAANTKMIKWNKFLGFIEEGRLRNHLLMDGAFQDAVFLGLLEPDYRKITVPRLKMLVGMGF